MSGPKVVNIEAIRRRQRRECNALLGELRAAVEEWQPLKNSLGEAGDSRKGSADVLKGLDGLRKAGDFTGLKVETTAQRDFYRKEVEALRQQNIERLVTNHRREHALRQAAGQVMKELQEVPPSPEREAIVGRLRGAGDAKAMQGAVAEALRLVGETRDAQAAHDRLEEIRCLANEYVDPREASSRRRKLPQAARDANDLRLERCWTLLAELETTEAKAVDAWKQKAREAEAMAGDERALRIDSLVLEMTSHLRQQRARQEAMSAVQSVVEDLVSVPESKERAAWLLRLEAAMGPTVEAAQALKLAGSARQWLEQEMCREDAREQRAAVLRALAALGYEVREGMATAWTDEGRVVIHKPDEGVYGLELSAPQTGPAFQVRVVAAGVEGRSQQRDKEVEETWCGEFKRLQSMLTGDGYQARLMKAEAAGVVPVKTLPARRQEPRQGSAKKFQSR